MLGPYKANKDRTICYPKKSEMTESEKKYTQRQFFKTVYITLFGKETGPRIPTFVWASDKSKLLRLLERS